MNSASLRSAFSNVVFFNKFNLPPIVKWIILALILLNVQSFPLFWHVRVSYAILKRFFQFTIHQIRVLLRSPSKKRQLTSDWFDSISAIGEDPFQVNSTYKTWASPDDCDYNFHISNSSYGKILDCARLKAAVKFFPRYMFAGGQFALGGIHFNFIREIPLFAKYEIRSSIGSWDEKWIYVVDKYVTRPTARSLQQKARTDQTAQTGAKKNVLLQESDGAVVHCIAVSILCFKMGRISVPPALILASSGLVGSDANNADQRYSRTNPPEHLDKVKELAITRTSKSYPYMDLLTGGWKNVPIEERWWDKALAPIEQQRKERLIGLQKFREGEEFGRQIPSVTSISKS